MGDFRPWFQRQMARLDGTKERRAVALGAMWLLIALNAGPLVLRAAAETLKGLPTKPDVKIEKPAAKITFIHLRQGYGGQAASTPNAEAGELTPTEPAAGAAAPQPLPAMAILFPSPGSSSASPVAIGVRIDDATAVAMLMEVRTAAGEDAATLIAERDASGTWISLFESAPGDYVVRIRASFDDGRVAAFEEQRAFTLLPRGTDGSTEPRIVLTAPKPEETSAGTVPLGARLQNAAPDSVVFVVRDAQANETIILGRAYAGGGYWSALFEGPAGTYELRARASLPGREIATETSTFTIAEH